MTTLSLILLISANDWSYNHLCNTVLRMNPTAKCVYRPYTILLISYMFCKDRLLMHCNPFLTWQHRTLHPIVSPDCSTASLGLQESKHNRSLVLVICKAIDRSAPQRATNDEIAFMLWYHHEQEWWDWL